MLLIPRELQYVQAGVNVEDIELIAHGGKISLGIMVRHVCWEFRITRSIPWWETFYSPKRSSSAGLFWLHWDGNTLQVDQLDLLEYLNVCESVGTRDIRSMWDCGDCPSCSVEMHGYSVLRMLQWYQQ